MGIYKIHLKCRSIVGFVVNGIPEPSLYSFALDKPPEHKIYKEPRIELFKKMSKFVLCHVTFCLDDDDHGPVHFNGETISISCQINKT